MNETLHMRQRNKKQGFTLVEVMVALFILSICVAVGVQSTRSSNAMLQKNVVKNLARWTLVNHAVQLQLNTQAVGNSVHSPIQSLKTNVEAQGKSWRIEQTVIATEQMGFVQVQLKIFAMQNTLNSLPENNHAIDELVLYVAQ